jgi:hypothetical protein
MPDSPCKAPLSAVALEWLFSDQDFITVSPPMMNLDPFSESIKTSITYSYQISEYSDTG